MKIKYFFIVVALFLTTNLMAQKKDSIIYLDEIVLPISKLKNFSKGYYTQFLSDTIVQKNNASLTDVLRFNTFLYFKENGKGLVSSPSFRGTNASQTAVVWNGININSQLNGQTDFNTIEINSLNTIAVRSGGGSVLYGSGAIGGTIHLSNAIVFGIKKQTDIQFSYGSFNTFDAFYKRTVANKNKYINTTITYNFSDNDYPYLGTDLYNENASYNNFSFSGNYGYKLNKKNQLKFYTTTFLGDRNLSRTLTAPSKSKYKNSSTKNLLVWSHFINTKEVISTKVAFLGEEYTYYEDFTNPNLFSEGNAKRWLTTLDYKNNISAKFHFNGILTYENTTGNGDNIEKVTRKTYSGVLLMNHKINSKLSYGAQIRKEYVTGYSSPLVYSFGVDYKLNRKYTLSLNTSKNFRIPTFNDLYWEFGGNLDLIPETSYQYELGNQLKIRNTVLQLNGFYISSKDLIQWRPDITGNWTPVNISETENYGFEIALNTKKRIATHLFYFSANYSYTIAKDIEKNRSLMYVPKHRVNFLLNYNFKKTTIYYQQLINGKVMVFINELSGYTVANLGIDYRVSNSILPFKIGLKINNIYNKNYQNVLNRPMPNRNISIKLNFKI